MANEGKQAAFGDSNRAPIFGREAPGSAALHWHLLASIADLGVCAAEPDYGVGPIRAGA